MEIKLVIEKRHVFLIVFAMSLLAGLIGVIAFDSGTTPDVMGHTIDELAINGDLVIPSAYKIIFDDGINHAIRWNNATYRFVAEGSLRVNGELEADSLEIIGGTNLGVTYNPTNDCGRAYPSGGGTVCPDGEVAIGRGNDGQEYLKCCRLKITTT
jgi:hypothetical protein